MGNYEINMSMPVLAGSAARKGYIYPSLCHNALKTAFFDIKSHLYCAEKKKKDRCCYSFPKHTTNALGHDLSLLFSARSPTLKT